MKRYAPFVLLVLISFAAARADAYATQPANIEYLQGDAGKAAIVDDSIDPYFSRLEDHEMTAKTGKPITGDTRDAKIAECKSRYQSAVLDFTDDEKQMLSFFVSKSQVPLIAKYPVFGNTPWSIVKTSDSLEGGMAWTRGSHVFLPEGMLKRFVMVYKRVGEKSLTRGASLLIHEQTHVVERLHPDIFVPLFTDTFHFIRAKKIESSSWLTDRQLINPDGTVCDWIFPLTEDDKPTFILPLIAFNQANPTNLRGGMGTIAVTMEKTEVGFKPVLGTDGNPIVRQLTDVEPYMTGPGGEQNNYHPNEIAADRFAELVVVDDLVDADTKQKMSGDNAAKIEQRIKPIRDWAKTAFALPAR